MNDQTMNGAVDRDLVLAVVSDRPAAFCPLHLEVRQRKLTFEGDRRRQLGRRLVLEVSYEFDGLFCNNSRCILSSETVQFKGKQKRAVTSYFSIISVVASTFLNQIFATLSNLFTNTGTSQNESIQHHFYSNNCTNVVGKDLRSVQQHTLFIFS